MRMTFLGWTVGVAIGCAAFAVVLLPLPPAVPQPWATAAPPQLSAEIGRLAQSAAEAQSAVRNYRSAQALDRWTAAARNREVALMRLDGSVPPSIAAQVERIAAQQWAALGSVVSPAHAEVFVYFDSTSIGRSGDSSPRRVLEPRKLVDVTFALPPATDGQRCVSLVRLRGSSPAHVSAVQAQSLIGVCGFYGAFGLPGAGVRAWLSATNYRFARQSDWSVARAPATDVSSLYTLSDSAGRCLTGDAKACRSALRLADATHDAPRSGGRVSWVVDANAPVVSGPPRRLLGDAEGELLADAVRSIGAPQFARFWQGQSDPDAAFQSASGMPFHTWTQQWLARTYGGVPEQPSARVRDLVWLLILAPVGLLLAARPRHRVLAERLFVRG